jgi:hypothetical protein
MSITIGIYDLFAYTVPGLLYLYVIFEFFRKIGAVEIEFSNIPDISSGIGLLIIALVIVAAYLAGHLFDFFALALTSRLTGRQSPAIALQRVLERFPNLHIRFQVKDWDLLFSLLRQRNLERSQIIDSFGANSIMFRNIFFGSLLLTLIQIYSLIVSYSHITLIVTIGILILCYVAFQRSRVFHLWFYGDIFEVSLDYGRSLEEVVAYGKNGKSNPAKNTHKKIAR